MAESTIDCQGCGTILRHLTEAETAEVAESPYEYTYFCRDCQNDIGGLVGQ